MAEPEPEVVDALPVLSEPVVVERPQHGMAPVAVQAAALAGVGVVAGAAAVALVKGRGGGRGSLRIGRGRKGRKLDVVTTRTFLVDVHLLDRR